MKQSQAATKPVKREPAPRSLLLAALAFFVLSYLATQKALFDSDTRRQIAAQLRSLQLATCSEGIRLPGIECPTLSIIRNFPPNSNEPLRYQFARLPSLSAAVDKLQWNRGSEADTARLLTIWKALELGRQRQSRKNHQAIPAITQLLQPVWEEYPDMVAAASCLYCGDSFSVLSSLIKTGTDDDGKLRALAMGHPRLLAEIAPTGIFTDTELERIATVHGELSSGGDSKTAEFIGKILLDRQDLSPLEAWLSKGLNGGRALGDAGLDAIPRELVIAAWEQGVRNGYDNVELSEYLVARGYRPALRWVVWLESTEFKYLHGWSYERVQGQYQSILTRFTHFPASKGGPLATFYSGHWASIYWDDRAGRWAY
ncbi:hypothetical protein [Microbulbifer sp.]|uniref:hypothetical protein n=1 Tax=Microbulbifer sp. TaxID=1908541 RepID=UPI003F31E365